VIALTHVCQVWREVFTSRPSLWTRLDLDSMGEIEVRVYLERSKSSPVRLSFDRGNLTSSDLFSQIVPQVIGRLGYLSIGVTPENIQDTTAHLSHPAPLLEDLSIYGRPRSIPDRRPVLASTLFDGNLSSLRELYLDSVRTELPWRNMVNLTTFTLRHAPQGETSARQLVDFFESAPHLREVEIYSATPTSGAQNGRLVSLRCLERMGISGGGPPSVLLEHLLIPAGAELILEAESRSSLIGDLLPRSLDNLKNLSNFTTIRLYIDEIYPCMIFSGPNGLVSMTPVASRGNATDLALELLARLDTSKTKRLKVGNGGPLSKNIVYQALLPMKDLRVLELCECNSLNAFIHALHPSASPSATTVCPKLEELVIVLSENMEAFDTTDVVGMAEARASRGKRLKTLGIADGPCRYDPLEDVLELGKHVGRVEYGPQVAVLRADDD